MLLSVVVRWNVKVLLGHACYWLFWTLLANCVCIVSRTGIQLFTCVSNCHRRVWMCDLSRGDCMCLTWHWNLGTIFSVRVSWTASVIVWDQWILLLIFWVNDCGTCTSRNKLLHVIPWMTRHGRYMACRLVWRTTLEWRYTGVVEAGLFQTFILFCELDLLCILCREYVVGVVGCTGNLYWTTLHFKNKTKE